MGEGRPDRARASAAKSPAQAAGLFRWAFRSYLAAPELPQDSLVSFRRERVTDFSIAISYALMEGAFVGVIADKVFHVHPMWLAFLSAAPMFGNLSSVAWARLAQHHRKVPLVVALQSLLVALVAAVALVPETQAGGLVLVGLMVTSRLVIGGLVTVRSVVWTQNYPGEMRARATSRLALLAYASMTATAWLAGLALDLQPERFGLLYVAGAALSSVGILAFAGIRVRGEEERGAPPLGSDAPAALGGLGAFLILRDDPMFARYLTWQFLMGVSNMMTEPIVVYVVSRELAASFSVSVALTFALPMGIGMLLLPLWASYIDRVHITEFRSRHSWLFVASQAITGIGALLGSLPVIGLGRVVLGVARGGGSLAWQLGHNDFARPERAGLYMGLHATLTGVRGAFAPFLGILLYLGFAESALLPAFGGLGGWTLLLAAATSTLAALGFEALRRRVHEGGAGREA
ncbi:MAG: hypothetical protein CL910_21590 [Deltaproteobacteria bacterium]|nr:hypothetical protein [Deltaproteobacteria bacterium]